MEHDRFVCPECRYESDMESLCPECEVRLVATCPTCGNPVVGESATDEDRIYARTADGGKKWPKKM